MNGKIDKAILDVSTAITKNIEALNNDAGLLSQNILSQLRNLVEHIALKIDATDNGKSDEVDYANIDAALKYIKTKASYADIRKFHENLRVSASHYTLDEESSERLMHKYIEKLYNLKDFVKEQFGLDILDNIHKFPLKKDTQTEGYYRKIVEELVKTKRTNLSRMERCYIQKKKTIFLDGKIYYELTVTLALSKVSKFDRIIVFTRHNVKTNYAVKLWLNEVNIKIVESSVPIKIAVDWQVSIRPCEYAAFSRIFGEEISGIGGSTEADRLNMQLTQFNFNLVDIVKLPQIQFDELKANLTLGLKNINIFVLLEKARTLAGGRNVVWYILYHMNYKIIKNQLGDENRFLGYLNLAYGCIPFDNMPFCSSLLQHKVGFHDMVDTIGVAGRDHEILARKIKSNTETNGVVYTPVNEFDDVKKALELISVYNDRLYYKHQGRKIKVENNLAFIADFEETILGIITKLRELQVEGIRGYKNSVKAWIDLYDMVDCDGKKEILPALFENSRVAFIYGSAGTGKTTIVKHLTDYLSGLKQKNLLYLAHTNTAVDNLRKRVGECNGDFKTITAFKRENSFFRAKYDLVVIDECSTVSNKDILEVLHNIDAEMLLLIGDIYQIEAIDFGNWFRLVREFIGKEIQYELNKPWRATDNNLLKTWDAVRKNDENIAELLARGSYSKELDETVFSRDNDDEIILCLNYDGLYGINNINSLLQTANKNKKIELGLSVFKVNDPIIFNDTKRFGGLLHNNLKGVIIDFSEENHKVSFTVKIDKAITELDVRGTGVDFIDSEVDGKSIVRFYVGKDIDTDEETDDEAGIIPFQIAYAMSIHKSQGLEYDSVKIIISNEIDERITHNVFYTAITRAKRLLKIYWSQETMQTVISNFAISADSRDICILKQKLKKEGN